MTVSSPGGRGGAGGLKKQAMVIAKGFFIYFILCRLSTYFMQSSYSYYHDRFNHET